MFVPLSSKYLLVVALSPFLLALHKYNHPREVVPACWNENWFLICFILLIIFM